MDDRELIIIAAAFINAMDRQMYNSRHFPRAEFGREIASMRQSPEPGVDIGNAMQQLKHHVLMLDSNFMVDGQLSRLSIWDLVALARYNFEEDRGHSCTCVYMHPHLAACVGGLVMVAIIICTFSVLKMGVSVDIRPQVFQEGLGRSK